MRVIFRLFVLFSLNNFWHLTFVEMADGVLVVCSVSSAFSYVQKECHSIIAIGHQSPLFHRSGGNLIPVKEK